MNEIRDRGGELRVQAVGLPVRVLCGIVAAAILVPTVFVLLSGDADRWVDALTILAVAVPFGALAAFGWRVPVIDPAASERFLELADPGRALTADDFAHPSREREPRPRSASAANPFGASTE